MRKLICFIILILSLTYSYSSNILESFSHNPVNQISPRQAFGVTAVLKSASIVKLHFAIMPGFYIYKDNLTIKSNNPRAFTNDDIYLPAGIGIDIFNGSSYVKETTLNKSFDVNIRLKHPVNNLVVTVEFLGCDGKSICYPPQHYQFDLFKTNSLFSNFKNLFFSIYSGAASKGAINPFELFLVFFLAGFAISLTPCMYPLYPIALSTISQMATKKSNIIKLTLCYIHGISLIYVLMGIIAALTGQLLVTFIQAPVFILLSSCIFLFLGLAMFDLLDIKLPNRLLNYIHIKTTNLNNSRYVSTFILGVLSSFLLGPCITPPLVIAISYIASHGNVLSGVLGLYAISLGMGLPILILSTAGKKLLPKSGAWMNGIKYILGGIIIAVAIYMAHPLVNLGNPMLGIGTICFIAALVFFMLKKFNKSNLELLIHKFMPILLIIIGLVFIFFGYKMPAVPTQPLTPYHIVNTQQLRQVVQESTKPVIIIVSAKWCSVCRELEATTFRDKNVINKFKQYTVIYFDITDNKRDSAIFLHQYALYGPPAMIILDKNKVLQDKIIGYISGADLIRRIGVLNY
ncbi:MAG: thiol:disulfide interchange protein DsbD [Burkholderiales bacterium]|nr:thiol:disulfide interchange protein DsbD [Burkholderiales bacterium]